ncbi:MAG: hypothetical protein C6W56_00950 [Caldibacillus debilis]|nr:MAG: hypothetical protein C6W56_00950 [Caldibacillus debilis]
MLWFIFLGRKQVNERDKVVKLKKRGTGSIKPGFSFAPDIPCPLEGPTLVKRRIMPGPRRPGERECRIRPGSRLGKGKRQGFRCQTSPDFRRDFSGAWHRGGKREGICLRRVFLAAGRAGLFTMGIPPGAAGP